ncbi:MAG: hypothetical protein A3G23_08450 [Bacteroidetes bacterium RIFCSPLOWO2_12_FULL_37_12]|nr:MAG: hypothetical protein A3G23_08450 [Bacteroidetes bacterium RIFCSPLOWO2_12_FULL_37_12]
MKLSLALFVQVLLCNISLFSQNIEIQLGNSTIASNEYYTITLVVRNENLKSYSPFPEIKGFTKRGTSSSSSTNISNGRISSSQSIIANYLPVGQGTFTLPAFSMTVNGKEVRSEGATIKVGPAQQSQPSTSYDPFADFFGNRNQPQEYVTVEADAFFGVISNKEEVFTGEGFNLTLAFYVSQSNKAQMNFYDLQGQLPDILKKIKPKDCWEENFAIEEVSPQPVLINGKKYTMYCFYQANFYPLKNNLVKIPSVTLKMIKYDVAKSYSFFGQSRKEQITEFTSRPVTIKIKDLPPHPLKDQVSVGNFRLSEKINKEELTTEQGTNYYFNIEGEGNIAGIQKPEIPSDPSLEIYPPDINQSISRGNNRVTGSKKFTYYLAPVEPGVYSLSKKFLWIFFNPVTARYDTLKSNYTLQVTGETRKNAYISGSDLGVFYNRIPAESNRIYFYDTYKKYRLMGMIVLAVLAGAVLWMRVKRG